MITYANSGKTAFFDGKKYCRDGATGYYKSSDGRFLHRAVYEKANGPIQDGYQIHHIDHDKANNQIANLELLTAAEHRRRHADEMDNGLRAKLRNNMLLTAIPAAAKWHKSEAGVAWHKEQYRKTKDFLHKKGTFICRNCGKQYEAISTGENSFCSGACKSAWRRKNGLNKEQRVCVVCGASFATDKYKKAVCCSSACANRLRANSRRVE